MEKIIISKNMLFRDIFKDYTVFKTWIDAVLELFKNSSGEIKAEWLDEKNMFSSFEMIFFYLNNFYKNRLIRFDSETFLDNFTNRFIDSTFSLYFKQLAFVNKELGRVKDISERDGANLLTTNSNDENNNANTATNFSGKNEPLTKDDNVAEKSQGKSISNSAVKGENYNIVENLKTLMNYQYHIGLDEFIESFNSLFRQFIGARLK